jgi:deoxyhypusine synthase
LVEIYDILVVDQNKKYEYMESLINTALKNVLEKNNKLLFLIDMDNTLEEICYRIGFKNKGISQTVSIVV